MWTGWPAPGSSRDSSTTRPSSSSCPPARETGAIPFDAPGVELGHHGGDCSFQTIVKTYRLKNPALLLLAEIVGCADTARLADHPVAAGLEAIAVGHSLRFAEDNENIARQFEVYDSLYARCRLEAARRG